MKSDILEKGLGHREAGKIGFQHGLDHTYEHQNRIHRLVGRK